MCTRSDGEQLILLFLLRSINLLPKFMYVITGGGMGRRGHDKTLSAFAEQLLNLGYVAWV